MIEVVRTEKNTIYYTCDCGAMGMCSFKPANKDSTIVIDVICPACQDSERITLLQYSSDESRKRLLNNIDAEELTWVPSINEEILQTE